MSSPPSDAEIADQVRLRGEFGFPNSRFEVVALYLRDDLKERARRTGFLVDQAEHDEILRRNRLAVDAVAIRKYAADVAANVFADPWLDHLSGGVLRVGLTVPVDSPVAEQALSVVTDPDRVRLERVNHSLVTLLAVHARIRNDLEALDNDGFSVSSIGIDSRSNRVVIGVVDRTDERATRLEERYGRNLVVVVEGPWPQPASRADDPPPFQAGEVIHRADGRPCTAGPVARHRGTGQRGLLTAGHCGDLNELQFHNGQQIGPMGIRHFAHDTDHDAGFVTSENVRWPKFISIDGSPVFESDIVGAVFSTQDMEGQTVCKAGSSFTNWSCGQIIDKYHTVRYFEGALVLNDMRHASAPAYPGDSGGPVVSPFHDLGSYHITGITSGCRGCDVRTNTAGTLVYSQASNVINLSSGVNVDYQFAPTAFDATVMKSENRMYVFARGAYDQVWWKRFHHGWQGGWELFRTSSQVGLTSSCDPVVESWNVGRLDVFGCGPSGELLQRYSTDYGNSWNPSWGWHEVPGGGRVAGSPAASSWGPNRLDVFVKGQDGHLYHKAYDNGWGAWNQIGQNIASSPGAVSWGANRIDVVARGHDGAAWLKTWNGSQWLPFQSLGGYFSTGLDITSMTSGHLDVFGVSSDRQVWNRYYLNGQWHGSWNPRGGSVSTDPSAVSRGPGSIDLLVRDHAQNTLGAIEYSGTVFQGTWSGYNSFIDWVP